MITEIRRGFNILVNLTGVFSSDLPFVRTGL